MTDSSTVTIRIATDEDALDVRRILDGAMLQYAPLEPRLDDDDVLVATDDEGRVRGTLVLEPEPSATVAGGIDATGSTIGPDEGERAPEAGAHIDAVAVRTRHRGRGIGSALVESALKREDRLTAHFDASVRPFYEALDFDVVAIDDDRFAGVRERRR